MDKLQTYIEYISNNSLEEVEEEIYHLISEIHVTEADEGQLDEILPNLYALCKNGRLHKYFVYLSCMANDNCRILQKFMEFDQTNANLTKISELEIFEFVAFKNSHWFLKILHEYNTLGKQNFNETMYQKILVAKLIESTNATNIDEINGILREMVLSDDRFTEFYKIQIINTLNIINFMKGLNPDIKSTSEIFHFIICNPLLSSFSTYITLQNKEHWSDIEAKLRSSNTTQNAEERTELDVFLSFTSIYTILSIILSMNKYAKDELARAKENFFKISSTKLQMEVINHFFLLIFLRKEHLKRIPTVEQEGYLIDSGSLSIILHFLKDIFETIKIQNKFDKESEEYDVFVKYNQYLADAIWRHEVITHIKSSKLIISPHRLIHYMLAPSESLIYLCLKHKDYERAQQVVRVSSIITI